MPDMIRCASFATGPKPRACWSTRSCWFSKAPASGGEDTRGSDFRFDNRQLEIGAGGGVDPEFPGFHGLDFKLEEVRNERFALVEETVNRYPVDGFELQLDYMPYYFRPDEVDAGRPIMTEWIARVHQAVKQSGAQRELAIRIPSSLEGCHSVGLEVREWIRQGIVDVLIGQNFSGPELLDHNANFRPLVAAAKGSQCRVHAAIHSHIDSDRLGEATVKMIRAAACNYWDQGVDGLYLAHWFSNWPYRGDFYEKLRELPYPEVMAPKDKTYFVTTTTGRYPRPSTEPGLSLQLPADLRVNQAVKVEMAVSDDLVRWHKAGRVHEVLLRARMTNSTELDRFSFRLNGKALPQSGLRKINQLLPHDVAALPGQQQLLAHLPPGPQPLAAQGEQHSGNHLDPERPRYHSPDIPARPGAGRQVPDGQELSPGTGPGPGRSPVPDRLRSRIPSGLDARGWWSNS